MSTYTGLYPKITVTVSRAQVIKNMQAWCKMISNDNRFYYKNWGSDTKTRQCPLCHPELLKTSYGDWPKNKDGWNCIGLAFAVWHHGGQLPSKCNCSVIANQVAEAILNAKTNAEALKIAQQHIGLKDIQVIRNNKKTIPQAKAKAGDIALLFNGTKYQHTYFIVSNTQVCDSTGGTKNTNDNIKIRSFTGRYESGMKVLIRWTGDSISRKYLQLGDSGDNIIKLQKFLNWAIEAKLKEDGKFGSSTEEAVKKFQKKVKIPQDGKWGADTSKAAKTFNKKEVTPSSETKPKEEPKKKTSTKSTYSGILPTTKLIKTNAQVIADTIIWACWIASDNRFHYGYTSKDKKINAHHNGCYFCGTNKSQKKGILDSKFTYCCNPFVGAAWAHGGCVPKALSLCQSGSSWDFTKGHGYDKSSLFDNLGHPAKSKLKKGDVLCRNGHVALYIGNGKIVQAAGGDDNKRNSARWNKSISITTLTDTNYKNFPRVHRFNGSVNTIAVIRHGEVSDRVAQWQAFLNWYFDGKVGKADRIFGDNTLKWTKKFQEEAIGKGEGDGLVGPKTLKAAAKVKK